jgi:type II secretory pathway component PulK
MTALALAVLIVLAFAAACWWRAYCLIRRDREQRRRIDAWWQARLDESSLLDDSPAVLPDEWPSRRPKDAA